MTDEEFAELEARYKAEKAARKLEQDRHYQREYKRAWRAKPETAAKRREYNRKHYLANREKCNARSKARYAKLKAAYEASKQ